MKSHWMEYQGKRIFFADYSGFGSDSEALRGEVEQAVDLLANEPAKSVLVLSSFEDTISSMGNLNVIRQTVQRANFAVIKRALLGVTGVRRIFLTTFNHVLGDTSVNAFDTQEQALDWLVSS
jgi:hypothetical protein